MPPHLDCNAFIALGNLCDVLSLKLSNDAKCMHKTVETFDNILNEVFCFVFWSVYLVMFLTVFYGFYSSHFLLCVLSVLCVSVLCALCIMSYCAAWRNE